MTEPAPYTFVTASIDEAGTRLGISFRTADLAVSVLGADRHRPVLDISGLQARVSISTTGGGPVTAQDLTLARQLADAATRYLTACERLHTDQVTDSTASASGEAAA
ncbi:hypothetical protein FHS43_000011 [Streptosporangium becharense]|uniref:Uncharacterized protein n=1 Tax=Streptosporangium becharense TaxID=1816182 RepID=A0A7W9IGA5_9ACTN|nr:hypothetical protein [Streptosporangium becharense]MBB2908765.1 hypothetical protein [Streptosporangium becharense]MBB5820217.1 hypothetical protein [Streptosporangium becharense]